MYMYAMHFPGGKEIPVIESYSFADNTKKTQHIEE